MSAHVRLIFLKENIATEKPSNPWDFFRETFCIFKSILRTDLMREYLPCVLHVLLPLIKAELSRSYVCVHALSTSHRKCNTVQQRGSNSSLQFFSDLTDISQGEDLCFDCI